MLLLINGEVVPTVFRWFAAQGVFDLTSSFETLRHFANLPNGWVYPKNIQGWIPFDAVQTAITQNIHRHPVAWSQPQGGQHGAVV